MPVPALARLTFACAVLSTACISEPPRRPSALDPSEPCNGESASAPPPSPVGVQTSAPAPMPGHVHDPSMHHMLDGGM